MKKHKQIDIFIKDLSDNTLWNNIKNDISDKIYYGLWEKFTYEKAERQLKLELLICLQDNRYLYD
jgi:hypothetical protein